MMHNLYAQKASICDPVCLCTQLRGSKDSVTEEALRYLTQKYLHFQTRRKYNCQLFTPAKRSTQVMPSGLRPDRLLLSRSERRASDL